MLFFHYTFQVWVNFSTSYRVVRYYIILLDSFIVVVLELFVFINGTISSGNFHSFGFSGLILERPNFDAVDSTTIAMEDKKKRNLYTWG